MTNKHHKHLYKKKDNKDNYQDFNNKITRLLQQGVRFTSCIRSYLYRYCYHTMSHSCFILR